MVEGVQQGPVLVGTFFSEHDNSMSDAIGTGHQYRLRSELTVFVL